MFRSSDNAWRIHSDRALSADGTLEQAQGFWWQVGTYIGLGPVSAPIARWLGRGVPVRIRGLLPIIVMGEWSAWGIYEEIQPVEKSPAGSMARRWISSITCTLFKLHLNFIQRVIRAR